MIYIISYNLTTKNYTAGGELVNGLKRFNFHLNISPNKSYPSPFMTSMTSNWSLTYRIYALIKRDNSWKIFADKLVNFKGYYNVLQMELNPFVGSNIIRTKEGKITATFSVPNTVAIMGQGDCLQGMLKLEGAMKSQTNATLTFYRIINCNGDFHTEVIMSQNRQAEIHQDNAIIKWIIGVPIMKRITYSNELIPMYSVRYYLKVYIHYCKSQLFHFDFFL